MGKMGSFNVDDLKKLQGQLKQLDAGKEEFINSAAKELAARLLAKTIKRTPVGVYPKSSGKMGGTLRRGWTETQVRKEGNEYVIEVFNPVSYAPYVEYGHRTRGGGGWVEGRFMLTISEKEVEKIAPNVLEAKLKKFLRGAL